MSSRSGDSLPSERRLAEVLGVSRPAVREALQRMAQTGLVHVRHGGATTVRDFRRYAGLDLLPRLLVRRGELDPAVARSILEARLAVGPGVAALAAERGGPALAAALTGTVDALALVDDGPEGDIERQVHALDFWDQVVDAADSLVFRLMFNSLRAAYVPALEALAPLMAAEVGQVDAYRVLDRRDRRRRPRDRARGRGPGAAPGHGELVERPRGAGGGACRTRRPEDDQDDARGGEAGRGTAGRRRGAHHRPGETAHQPLAARRVA